jgi:hypothetical protein
MALIILITAGLLPTVALAQSPDQAETSGCVGCHQDLYLYYDTGKSFCLCETKMTCTDCHAGDPAAITADEAHIGMVARPACTQTNTCQDCHTADYQGRVDQFATVSGIHPTPCPLPECAHPTSGETIEAEVAECDERVSLPLKEIGAGLLGALSIGLVFLAVYLYRIDNPTEGS